MRRTIFHRKCEPWTLTSSSAPSSAMSTESTRTRVDFSSGIVGRERLEVLHPDERGGRCPHRADVE